MKTNLDDSIWRIAVEEILIATCMDLPAECNTVSEAMAVIGRLVSHEVALATDPKINGSRELVNVSVRQCLGEAVDIIDHIVEGGYSPDGVTTQPWKQALRAHDENYISWSDYDELKESGMLWEFYPEFTGNYLEDVWKQKN